MRVLVTSHKRGATEGLYLDRIMVNGGTKEEVNESIRTRKITR